MKRLAPLAIVLLALGVACANNVPSPEVQRVAREYQAALDDPIIDSKNSIQLMEAKKDLDLAEQANRDREQELVTHYTYLAEQRIRIARLTAETRVTDAATKKEMGVVATRAAELERELADLEARQTERGAVLALGGVHFGFNESELKPEAAPKLARLAGFLIANPNRGVLVDGYGDIVGPDPANLKVSQERADAVKRYLVANGVSPDRITTKAHGGADPLLSNQSTEGRDTNRRVEITILPPGSAVPEAGQEPGAL